MAIGDLSDADFLALMNSMAATISANLANYPGITAAMMTIFGAVRDNYSDKLNTHNMKQDEARAARIDKDFERANGEEEQVRSLRDMMKAHGVTDELCGARHPVGRRHMNERYKHYHVASAALWKIFITGSGSVFLGLETLFST